MKLQKINLALPEVILGELFIEAALQHATSDGKVLADAVPKYSIDVIKKKYEEERHSLEFTYTKFISENFELPIIGDSGFVADKSSSVVDHIKRLWPILTRHSDVDQIGSSRISLPFPYIVPGGRFNEIYYWDSYFTMLGLAADGMFDLLESMIENFAWLIDQIGFIPNGNRTYFLSRSQPPFFSLMVTLLADHQGKECYQKYLPQLLKEHQFWMSNDRKDDSMPEGLNRYWDKLDTPRSEMYEQDYSLASKSEGNSELLFRNLRSACESGWDFSSRWLKNPLELASIHTTDILPIDLNCLLYHLELILSKAHLDSGHEKIGNDFFAQATSRKEKINELFYNEKLGYYFDYDFKAGRQKEIISAAGISPLFFGIASEDNALRCLHFMKEKLLKKGGIVSTNVDSGQQWDSPNGWAPLQWMAFQSAINYNEIELAKDIARNWMDINEKVFHQSGKMMEKYNVVEIDVESGGGEYPVQDGFGWTNGVYLAMKKWLSQNDL